jgi:hypothetical protein
MANFKRMKKRKSLQQKRRKKRERDLRIN